MLGELLLGVPELQQTDLVIEGGVGGNRAMARMVKRLFPRALYIGTDLHPIMIPQNRARLSGSIDPQTYQEVLTANKSAGLFPENALVWADCFDGYLVRDIMWRSARRFPLLVSFDALPFFIWDSCASGERKLASDRHSIDDIVSTGTPFIEQLHVSSSQLWHGNRPRSWIENCYYSLEDVAQRGEWITGRLPNALILIRK